jgi:hypothetical protein
MAHKYTQDELTGRLASPGWKVVTGNDSMPIIGTLKQMLETTHDRHRNGLASGYIQEMETAIEVDMLQIQALWHQLGLPT